MNAKELVILDFIQEHLKCGFLDVIMPTVSWFGDKGIFWIALALVLLTFKKTRKMGCALSVTLITGLILGNGILKNAFSRPRPFTVNPDFKLLVKPLMDGSFPSGHVRVCAEGTAVLFLYKKYRFAIASTLLTATVAFSRIYLYVHYPTDLLGGAVLGIFDAVVGFLIVQKLFKKFSEKKSHKITQDAEK